MLITPRTRMLVVNSPQNPTGGILTREDCEAIAQLAIKHDLIVLSDEIYNRLSYDGTARVAVRDRRHGRADDLHGRPVQGMGDVRLAARVRRDARGDRPKDGHADDQQLVVRRGVHAMGRGRSVRFAGVGCGGRPMVAEFGHRRDRIVDLLNEIPGFKCHRPAGAFYVFPDITATGFGDRELASSLLDEVGRRGPPGSRHSDRAAPGTSA